MKGSTRTGRVNDVLHRELAVLIRDECHDPRLGMVTISAVEVSRDLAFAKVYVTVLEDDKQLQSVRVLNHAAGFFRSLLAKHVALRTVPKLKFVFDDSMSVGNRLADLIESTKPKIDDTEHEQ